MEYLKVITLGLLIIFAGSACHEDPEPLIGKVENIDRDSVVGNWFIQEFTLGDSNRTPDFENVVLDFEQSSRLNIIKNGQTFEGLWSLRATSIALSVDVVDTVLRELSGVYVADELSPTVFDLQNSNPRTPARLLLVRP